ncbi:MAG: GxxExxY protein [Betaproteobacteria bacterium]|nr:GxxExxY protein [Betaproteobacteria bacterium]
MNTDFGLKGSADVSRSVIGAAFRVANGLGIGFVEKVYENALAIELRLAGHDVEHQRPIDVRYRGEVVGICQADLLVDQALVIELKVADAVSPGHKAQCLNYLRATGLHTGLVINFGRPRIEVHRLLS